MIIVEKITSKKGMKDFVKFPFKLYKDNPYWVPPIIKDELANFNKNINPVFKNADAQFFVAKKNGQIVGRVCAIINWFEVEKQHIKNEIFALLLIYHLPGRR